MSADAQTFLGYVLSTNSFFAFLFFSPASRVQVHSQSQEELHH